VTAVLQKAEAHLPEWVQSLSQSSRARLSVELMLLDGAEDPSAFFKRAFRADCVIVVSFVLHGGKSSLSAEEDAFLHVVLKCTHASAPASDSALPTLLDHLVESRTGIHILCTPRVARVLPQSTLRL